MEDPNVGMTGIGTKLVFFRTLALTKLVDSTGAKVLVNLDHRERIGLQALLGDVI